MARKSRKCLTFPKAKHSTENLGIPGGKSNRKFPLASRGCPLFQKLLKMLFHLSLEISEILFLQGVVLGVSFVIAKSPYSPSNAAAGFIDQSKTLTRFSLCSPVSVRSESTPDNSPEFGSRHRIPKRRIHRSSAPGQLTTNSIHLSSPPSVSTPASIKSEPAPALEPESPDVFMSVSMDSEPSVNQDTDLEIEAGGADSESIDPGMVEYMEVEEEEDVNGDVIRCLCNESEEGGFMIQVILYGPK